jgi:thiol-disulfide isomerase/thioredoxin
MSTISLLIVSVASLGAAQRGEVLDFTGMNCIYCQRMDPIVSRLQREKYPIRKVDVHTNRELMNAYGIEGLPTFVLVIDGKEVERVVGATSEENLRRMVARIPSASDDTAARDDQPEAAEPAPAVKRRSPDIPVVTVADGNTKPGFGLSLPFLSRKRGNSDGAVQIENEKPPVVRAKLDGAPASANVRPAEGAGLASAQPAVSVSLASSARLRVQDRRGLNFGSGTVIESRPGRSIVLTCGHVFRELGDEATIKVDVFQAGEVKTYEGKVIDFDLDADVGLVAISTKEQISAAKVAPEGGSPKRGDDVTSVGCGSGNPPTEEELRVTELNRYTGPDNIECTGVPVLGRSGGGLFNDRGEVIGVCIAADGKEKRGLYAGMKPIHDLLERAELAYLYRDDAQQPALAAARARRGRSQAPADEFAAEEPARPSNIQLASLEAPSGDNSTMPLDGHRFDQSLLESLPEAIKAGESEVICIIRPVGNAQAASRVVIINRASPKFLSYLEGELEAQPHETMHSVRWTRAGASAEAESSSSRRGAAPDACPDAQQATAWKPTQPGVPAVDATNWRRYRRSPESRLGISRSF